MLSIVICGGKDHLLQILSAIRLDRFDRFSSHGSPSLSNSAGISLIILELFASFRRLPRRLYRGVKARISSVYFGCPGQDLYRSMKSIQTPSPTNRGAQMVRFIHSQLHIVLAILVFLCIGQVYGEDRFIEFAGRSWLVNNKIVEEAGPGPSFFQTARTACGSTNKVIYI